VILVHHAGKDSSKGARGWSGLRAAADAELEVARDGDDRAIRLTKAKDDIDGVQFGFRLNTVSVGTDEDGDADCASCVVEPTEGVVASVRGKKRPQGDVQKIVLRVLADMVDLGGADVHFDDLVAGVVAQLPQESGVRDQRPTRVKRAGRETAVRRATCRFQHAVRGTLVANFDKERCDA
jgi:hypothetical protein